MAVLLVGLYQYALDLLSYEKEPPENEEWTKLDRLDDWIEPTLADGRLANGRLADCKWQIAKGCQQLRISLQQRKLIERMGQALISWLDSNYQNATAARVSRGKKSN